MWLPVGNVDDWVWFTVVEVGKEKEEGETTYKLKYEVGGAEYKEGDKEFFPRKRVRRPHEEY